MPWDGIHFRLDDPKELGQFSHEARQLSGLSTSAVAERMECAYNQVCAWEKGTIIPGLQRSISLAKAQGYEVYLVKKGWLRRGQSE